ncbi:hypothetical protein J3R73_003031 [Labrys monachus]|uniref:Uncharacterized protein n=1 Tax=Labrys monachus TaxID=217067 RepID=A0ABU0FGI4_9HYPH|nr:hypothetical protein [Labrys monachus]
MTQAIQGLQSGFHIGGHTYGLPVWHGVDGAPIPAHGARRSRPFICRLRPVADGRSASRKESGSTVRRRGGRWDRGAGALREPRQPQARPSRPRSKYAKSDGFCGRERCSMTEGGLTAASLRSSLATAAEIHDTVRKRIGQHSDGRDIQRKDGIKDFMFASEGTFSRVPRLLPNQTGGTADEIDSCHRACRGRSCHDGRSVIGHDDGAERGERKRAGAGRRRWLRPWMASQSVGPLRTEQGRVSAGPALCPRALLSA